MRRFWRRILPRYRLLAAVPVSVAAVTLAACGGDGGGSPVDPRPSAPSIAIVQGGRASDTITALIPTPLTVEVKDEAGRPVAGATIRFASDTFRNARAYFAGSNPFSGTYAVDAVSDNTGRASVRLRLGEVAGTAALNISAPAVGVAIADTVVVRRGAPVRLRAPRDTAVFIGGTTVLTAAVVDLDLSNYRFLTPSLGKPTCNGCALPLVVPRWHPNGTRIVFSGGYDNGYNADPARVTMTDLSGSARVLLGSPAFTLATDPAFSKDGTWLYLAGVAPGTGTYRLWRARGDGSTPEPLRGSSGSAFEHERRPHASPDGSIVAYALGEHPTGPRLWLRNVVTGMSTPLNVFGSSPRWSPAGDLIAFYVGQIYDGYSGELHVIRPDGRGERRLAPGSFASVFDWSPDGKYIVAERGDAGGVSIIGVATGVTVRLTWDARFGEPSWKPVAQ